MCGCSGLPLRLLLPLLCTLLLGCFGMLKALSTTSPPRALDAHALCGAGSKSCREHGCESPEVLVIVAHYSYNVSWLERQPFCYVVMHKNTPNKAPRNTPFNKAQEASSYLQFIVDQYHRLPKYMIFLHDHRMSWHSLDLLQILPILRFDAYGFVSLNALWNRGIHPRQFPALQNFFKDAGLARWLPVQLPDSNNAIQFMCCAQFLVSRDRVLAR